MSSWVENFEHKVKLALESAEKLLDSNKRPVLCDRVNDILYNGINMCKICII